MTSQKDNTEESVFSSIEALTPSKIAEGEYKTHRFNIPIYQRLFEWNGDTIKRMLDDLMEQCDQDKEQAYYIGMLTANQEESTTYQASLVDGQQRFTVTMLMGLVLRHYYEEWDKFLCTPSGEVRLYFAARKNDITYLRALLEEYKKEEPNIDAIENANIKMRDGIKSIEEWISKEFENKEEKKRVFAEYVYSKMSFFISYLPDHYKLDGLNRYFEAMNSFGKNLDDHEILKVEMLKILPEGCDHGLYSKTWDVVANMDKSLISDDLKNPLPLIARINGWSMLQYFEKDQGIKSLEKEENSDIKDNSFANISEIKELNEKPKVKGINKDSHHSMLTFSEFLLQVLYLHIGDDNISNKAKFFDAHKLLETFTSPSNADKWKDKESVDKFFRDLLKYRLIFDYFFIRIPNNNNDNYRIDINYIEDAKNDKEKEDKKNIDILGQFQSMLYTCSFDAYKWIAPCLLFLSDNIQTSPKELYIHLNEIDLRERKSKQLDDPFSMAYDNDGHKVNTYWFRRLDFALWRMVREGLTNNDAFSGINVDENFKRIVKNYKFRFLEDIEHLHPQNEGKSGLWSKSDDPEHKPDDKYRFGNLALVSKTFNINQSNDNLDDKFFRIKQQVEEGKIQSIKLYLMYCLAGGIGDKWNEELMNKHGNDMLEVLRGEFDSLDKENQKTSLK